MALTPERYLRLVRLRTLRNRRSELDDYLDVARQRRRMYPRAALVGALSGLLASVFRMLLTGAGNALDALLVWSHAHDGLLRLAPVATMAATAALAVWLVRRFAPEAAGSGIPNLKAVLLRLRPMRAMRLLAVKLVGGVLAIGGGLVLGREGPTVQMGGAVGDEVARRMGSPPRERLTLTAAGAGTGLATTFNAPLSGLVFVLEDVQRDFRPIVFGAAFVAAAANVVSRFLSGPFPVFTVPSYPPPLETLPFFVVVGVLAGLFGAVYNRSLLRVSGWFGKAKHPVGLAALVGAVVGAVALFAPLAVGNGHRLAEEVLLGQ